ncbi:hypothetical protein QBC33DRAFT_514396 [Phialemonium atrogriseum]|uniref:Uncharacterized protein n=1 Tax=Phialemonium atrogriseum TaxID=1093897 RepID=A0AAJ0C0W9_9PEZI|nr:uncharacterized protein QBC33DRAFT_514396 [Phialemonium atrogriseum]KAK1768113.1 hypothetical protein QBC33DRAFT_514396 [Phialemonium atrogriseum]
MPVLAVQGFRMLRDDLNKFLVDNGLSKRDDDGVSEEEEEEIVFVCFHWVYLLSNKRIDNELDKPVPTSFEHLRQMLQVQSPICQYLLKTDKPTKWNLEGLNEQLNKPGDNNGLSQGYDSTAYNLMLLPATMIKPSLPTRA